MDGLLKGYYGYKNLGDEVLFFGAVNKIFAEFQIEKLFVETGDKDRFSQWVEKNRRFLDFDYSSLEFVNKGEVNSKGKKLFLGGGEVLADQRKFPYEGWNLLFKFRNNIKGGDFVLIGGISRVRKLKTKFLYKLVLPRAEKIIVRERDSFDIARKYNQNVELYKDFAKDVYDKLDITKAQEEKIFINVNPYIYNVQSLEQIMQEVKKYSHCSKYFLPFDINEDTKFYEEIKRFLPDLEIYDWTEYDIKEIFEFLAGGKMGIGARLHFLLFLKWLGTENHPLFYQDKIEKFFK